MTIKAYLLQIFGLHIATTRPILTPDKQAILNRLDDENAQASTRHTVATRDAMIASMKTEQRLSAIKVTTKEVVNQLRDKSFDDTQ